MHIVEPRFSLLHLIWSSDHCQEQLSNTEPGTALKHIEVGQIRSSLQGPEAPISLPAGQRGDGNPSLQNIPILPRDPRSWCWEEKTRTIGSILQVAKSRLREGRPSTQNHRAMGVAKLQGEARKVGRPSPGGGSLIETPRKAAESRGSPHPP